MSNYTGMEIAVVGMSGRFPGANNVEEFWQNLKEGIESVKFFTEDELLAAGEKEEELRNPLFVNANSYLSGKENFDSTFFNYLPSEAALMDPQIRIFHECVWGAMEDAGYNIDDYKEKIGLFAGASSNINWQNYALITNADKAVDSFTASQLYNSKFLCTRLSFLFNLRGPSLYIDTACSTSLVAIQRACNSLLFQECKMALAGGVYINNKSKNGYLYKEGMILSKDGHCRAFDKDASGTVVGEGAGVVVLKRLADAIAEGDNIHAIIKGSSVNNDGYNKVSFSAPSIDGQSQAIMKARKMAKVDPETIGYVETHGTGTLIGDPIEVEALNLSFGKSKDKYCAIGSVKTNLGHLDAAAGVAGLIKTVLALKHRQIPPSLHFNSPNPKINFENSPFYVNTELKEWRSKKGPLRAGVSSFGIGGTNAHVILEEAPAPVSTSDNRPYHVLNISAKSPTALKRNIANLRTYFEQNIDANISNVAYTLKVGRSTFPYRTVLLCRDRTDALEQLSDIASRKSPEPLKGNFKSSIAFMFPGQGVQYLKMGLNLYEQEKVFRDEADRCFHLYSRLTGKDIKQIMFSETQHDINDTKFTQPTLFIVEFALARLMMSWGLKPDIMIGHSIGEYVAACISGVFALEDAIKLVIRRGELMQKMPVGDMLSISISEKDLNKYLQNHQDISLATVNSSASSVVSGSTEAIENFRKAVEESGYLCKKVQTSHAFHSHMMDEMLSDFEKEVSKIKINPQQIPFISNLTGKRALDSDLTKPKYWVDQLRKTVKFSNGIEEIMEVEKVLFVEMGPGKVLSSFVGSNKSKKSGHLVVNLLGNAKSTKNDAFYLLSGLSKLWLNGVDLNWKQFYAHEKHLRVSLPTYSFDKVSYPVNVDAYEMVSEMISDKSDIRQNISEWYYTPTWKIFNGKLEEHGLESGKATCNLLFADNYGIADGLVEKFKGHYEKIVTVKVGEKYERLSAESYIINPDRKDDFNRLFQSLSDDSHLPNRIIHGWGIKPKDEEITISAEKTVFLYSLLNTIKVAPQYKSSLKEITVLTNGLHNIFGQEKTASPVKSMSLGLLKVIGQEYPHISTGHIDISLDELADESLIPKLYKEIKYCEPGKVISYRKSCRWIQIYDKIKMKTEETPVAFRKEGVYLITGGLGEFGYSLSNYLSKNFKAKLILLGRSKLPAREQWEEDDPNSDVNEKLKKIKSLEAVGGKVLYVDCDISIKEDFDMALNLAEEKFGKINGVFHAAGVLSGKSKNPINQLVQDDFETQFSSKLNGLIVLKEVLKDKKLDFCVLTSSLASVLGGLGFGAYSAANTFMDYYIQAHRDDNSLENWMSVNFDGLNFEDRQSVLINSAELPEVINRVLSMKELPQIAISTKELQPRIDDWISKQKFDEEESETLSADSIKEGEFIEILSGPEKSLMKLWQNFFGRTDFGPETDFFEMGGDSLKALTMISQINKKMKVELSLTDFFENSTIQGLSAIISKSDKKKPNEIKKALVKDNFKLSSAQQRLYFLHQYDDTSLAYNLSQVIKLKGALDKSRLEQVFKKLIHRHESLRTSFEVVNDEVFQKISEDVSFSIEYAEVEEADIKSKIDEFIRPFDLSKAPLIRIGLLKTANKVHNLIVDIHHIITDGVSQGVLISDFTALYKNEELPVIDLHYKDYAEWQQSDAQQERLITQRDFWKREFEEEVKLLDLPTDFPRPAIRNHVGNNIDFLLSVEDTDKLQSLSELSGATMFMTVLSIFNVLLSKLSNQTDIAIGTPIAGRDHADLQDILGVFINTLVLRNYPEGNLSFGEFLSKVVTKTLSSFDNQSYQYEELIEELNIDRDTSRNPLFDVMFVFQNYERSELIIPGLELEPVNITNKISKFDLTLTAVQSDGQLRLNFEYSTALFNTETINRMINYFHTIVSSVINNPSVKLSDITLLSANEKNQLLEKFNDTKTVFDHQMTIDSIFEEMVKKFGDQTAINFKAEKISYEELDKRSNRLANRISRLCKKDNTFIGIALERSPEVIVSILAVLKSGHAYVPIDPDYPVDRIKYIIDNCNSSLLLTDATTQSLFSQISEEISTINVSDKDLEKELINFAERKHHSSDLAYMIYTSGSTGNPKGVMITHRNVVNFSTGIDQRILISEFKSVLSLTTMSFDIFVLETLVPLLKGLEVVLADTKDQKDSVALYQLIKDQKPDCIQITPMHLNLLLSNGHKNILKDVKVLLVGGEEFPGKLLTEIKENYTGKIYNMYGPTESTVWSTIKDLTDSKTINIGSPIANTHIRILDEEGKLQPIGVIGELCIGGEGVANGYWNNDQLTNEKFIIDPVTQEGVIYRTGDVARWLPDGNIEFLGRADDQVKIRGYRIELGEIESRLAEHSEIIEAVVIAKERQGGKVLIAYYVSLAEQEISELRSFLAEKMPEYMIPNFYMHMDHMPLTPNGKINKRAFPEPELSKSKGFVKASTETEIQLLTIWTETLNLKSDAIGITTSFFELGGHSVLAMKLINRIEKKFGAKVNLPDFFQSPTIKGVAQVIENGNSEDEVLPTLVNEYEDRYKPFPMTDVQQAYWIGRKDIYEFGGVGTHGYSEIFIEELDVYKLNVVLNKIIARHEMLRMVVTSDGEQRILEEVPLYKIPVLDLNIYEEEEGKALFYEQREELSHQVFTGEEWPLFDIRVTAFRDGTFKIHYSMDMLIMDVGSSNILFDEFADLYNDETKTLPVLDISFRDYVQTEMKLRENVLFKKSKEYWLSRIDSMPLAPELALMPVEARPSKPVFKRHASVLETTLWNELQSKAKSMGVTPTILMIGSFAEILNSWSASSHFALNLTLFNRIPFHESVDRLIGDFTSLTLLEADFRGSEDFSTGLNNLQKRLWQDLEHKYFSGVEVQRELSRKHGHTITMPVVITSTLGLGDESKNLKEEEKVLYRDLDELQERYSITQTPQVWIDFQFGESREGLSFNWDCIEGLFPEGMIEEMFASYDTLLRSLAAGQDLWTSKLKVALPDAQLEARRQINETNKPESGKLLHELFLERVKGNPDSIAVVTKDHQLTYLELGAMSNALGHLLRREGARPNKLIAIVMNKGWEQVVASMGILYSGAAYLPIAADLPQSRITLLLEQGETEIVLTTSTVSEQLEFPEDKKVILIDDNLQESIEVEEITLVQKKEDLAYVIFTSGSTGMPKGVVIDHRGAVNTILDINSRFNITNKDSVLALSNLSFDLSVYDIFGLLAAGGTLVIPQQNEIKSPDKWIEYIQKNHVTIWNTVPALMQMLTEFAEDMQIQLPLKNVLMSGDWIPVSLPDKIRELCPQAEIVSLGGATEASIWSIFYPIGEVGEHWQSIPYGKPLTNQQFHVLKPDMTPCPDYIAGDLYIGGIGLAKGYWKDQEKTEASFVTHPVTGERLYKTGDLGRYLSDGNIEFLGREDNQVKIQGYRIELGEIEEALKAHEQIQNAAVITSKIDGKDKSLIAYVVGKREKEQSGDSVGANIESLDETITDPIERKLFKMEGHGIREFGDSIDYIQLNHTAINGKIHLEQKEPKDFQFVDEIMSLEEFSGMLECLKQNQHEDLILPKYYYPSAGSTYPVQTYLRITANSVEGVKGGYYYYNPKLHSLELINSKIEGDKPDEFIGSVSLYLIADLNAIAPLYGSLSEEFCFSEAGYIANLLINHYPEHLSWKLEDKIAENDHLADNFQLGSEHLMLMEFTGGVIEKGVKLKTTFSPLNTDGVKTVVGQESLEVAIVDTPVSCSFSSLARKSYRTFCMEMISADAIAKALNTTLIQSNSPVFKDQDLNLYLLVKQNRVEGIEEGCYYWDPVVKNVTRIIDHELGSTVFEGNEWIYDRAGFSILLTGKKTRSSSFISGYIGQNMMNFNIDNLLGLCTIGTVNQDVVKEKLMLAEDEVVIQSWLGGSIEEHQVETTEHVTENVKNVGAEENLKEFLQVRLPHYMIPSHFVPIDSIPLSSNGKLDKKALPAIEIESKSQHLAPESEQEKLLAGIWAKVLEIEPEKIGINANFFELGGNSIKIIALHKLIKAQFTYEIRIQDLFDNQTISECLDVINQDSGKLQDEDNEEVKVFDF